MLKKIALLLLTTVFAAHADVTKLLCVQTAPGEYTLSYVLAGDSHKVEISASTDPTGKTGLQSLRKTSETTVALHAGKPGERMYFFVKPDHGERREVSIRRLPLEGTPNFRDLGGYETTDGHFVQWGKIYRSGVLSYLTPPDLTYLSQLGVRVVCDFRTEHENQVAPEKYVENVEHISLPIGTDASGHGLSSMQTMLANNPTPDQLRARMIDTYSGFAFRSAPEYAKVFVQLKEDRLPLLYHCSGGKDRTGAFSAFLLLTLGVPEDTVLADYALTNNYLKEDTPANRKMMAAVSPEMSRLTPEQMNVLIAADPVYLKSMLTTINTKYGSFDNYRREELGVSDKDVEQLKAKLLTN